MDQLIALLLCQSEEEFATLCLILFGYGEEFATLCLSALLICDLLMFTDFSSFCFDCSLKRNSATKAEITGAFDNPVTMNQIRMVVLSCLPRGDWFHSCHCEQANLLAPLSKGCPPSSVLSFWQLVQSALGPKVQLQIESRAALADFHYAYGVATALNSENISADIDFHPFWGLSAKRLRHLSFSVPVLSAELFFVVNPAAFSEPAVFDPFPYPWQLNAFFCAAILLAAVTNSVMRDDLISVALRY